MVTDRDNDRSRADRETADSLRERESTERYRAIVEAFDGLIYICSKDYRIEFMNQKLIDRTGYDATGELCYKVLHDLNDVCPWCVNDRVQLGEKVTWEIQSPLDGRWYNIVNTPIHHPDGTVSKQAMIQDITERKQAAVRMEELLGVVSMSPVAAFLWQNRQGWPVEYVTDNVERIFGHSAADFMDGSVAYADVVHPDDLQRVTREVERHSAEGDRQEFTHQPYRIIHKNGREVWVEDRTIIRRDEDGAVTHFQGVLEDITEKRRLERQLLQAQKMQAIGTLAGGIAHDFNNLLMGIQGHTSLMMMDIHPDHPHHPYLKGIETAVESASGLTRQLLGFARGGTYQIVPTDMNHLINEVTTMFGRTKKEIRIVHDMQPGLHTVEVDRRQIESLLLNILINAWQAMPGGGEIGVKTVNLDLDAAYARPLELTPGSYVRVAVSDTGSGMDESTRERAFDPFFTTKERGQGTGLGLASSYGIAKNHNGLLTIDSALGEGTTVNLLLPATNEELKDPVPVGGRIEAGGDETILLVDDEEVILDVSRMMLEQLGYSVLTAGSGREAVEVYREHRNVVQLVVMDMIMPDLNGGEAVDEIRHIDPDARVLLSSGYSVDGQAQDILDRGCAGFIQKPYSLDQLSVAIRTILDSRPDD